MLRTAAHERSSFREKRVSELFSSALSIPPAAPGADIIILESGTKVLIAHRRLYAGDHGRFFVGVVDDYDDGIARIEGYTWIHDGYDGTFNRKSDKRTKIVPIISGSVIVYELPASLDIEDFIIETVGNGTMARDNHEFEMDLSEGRISGSGEIPRDQAG